MGAPLENLCQCRAQMGHRERNIFAIVSGAERDELGTLADRRKIGAGKSVGGFGNALNLSLQFRLFVRKRELGQKHFQYFSPFRWVR